MNSAEDPKKEKAGVDPSALLDDIFADEQSGDSTVKAFADLEQLAAVEIAAETESVVQELRIRQGE